MTYEQRMAAIADRLKDCNIKKVSRAVSISPGVLYNIVKAVGVKPRNSTLVVLSQYLGIKE